MTDASSIYIEWMYLFIDVPRDVSGPVWDFWVAALGGGISPTRGEFSEFATVWPETGDSMVKLQAVGSAQPGTHLDLDVADPAAASAVAVELGATAVEVVHDGVYVMSSPGGYTFCLTQAGTDAATRQTGPAGPLTVGHLCLDVPSDCFDAEVDFWNRLTGWELKRGGHDEFVGLVGDERMPFALLLQRLGSDDPRTSVTGHPDLDVRIDRPALVDSHRQLGAGVVGDRSGWTVMSDPAGLVYCVVDATGPTGCS